MALGVVACRLPGRVERDGVGCRAHCRAVPDAARARVLVALLRAHRTLTMRQPSALAATTATRGRLARRRWRGRGGLLWKAAELATSAGPHGRTAASLPLGPVRLSSSPRVRSAAQAPGESAPGGPGRRGVAPPGRRFRHAAVASRIHSCCRPSSGVKRSAWSHLRQPSRKETKCTSVQRMADMMSVDAGRRFLPVTTCTGGWRHCQKGPASCGGGG